ncbi:MAG: glycosyltransferase [Tetragenococcus koreensis]|nr:glycosyltransferase [Tetragenococcus koreensis]
MVSIIVPAHNEENVIEKKIVNLLNISYPKDKYEIIISSDNSTDKTNNIVKSYQVQHKDIIKLYNVESRKGKTNAQDEAVDIAQGEILVFTDANSIFDKQALTELIKTLSDKSIGYVAGKLSYLNSTENKTSESEASYWNIDLSLRLMESI